jgi:hypothetical protein
MQILSKFFAKNHDWWTSCKLCTCVVNLVKFKWKSKFIVLCSWLFFLIKLTICMFWQAHYGRNFTQIPKMISKSSIRHTIHM